MRRSILGFCLFSFVLASSSGVFAQKTIDKSQINDRIKQLRNRLKEYQSTIKKAPETVEIKLEKISEELESREDVAVTVLFHDPEASSLQEDLKENSFENTEEAIEDEVQVDVANVQAQRLEEMKRRQQLFDSLRAKVQQATRRSRENAREIHSLVAQIPDNN